MENRDGEIHVETDDARGGSTPNIVRWVLAIGLLLAVVGMSLAWIIPALTRDGTQNTSVSAQILEKERASGQSTDSIVGENADRIDAPSATAATAGGQPTVENQASDRAAEQ